jgi:hypothetical protein
MQQYAGKLDEEECSASVVDDHALCRMLRQPQLPCALVANHIAAQTAEGVYRVLQVSTSSATVLIANCMQHICMSLGQQLCYAVLLLRVLSR